MNASLVFAALAVALLPLHVPGQNAASQQVQLKKGDRIVFFGDSLTALAVKDPNVPEGKGYVPLVRAALKDAIENMGRTVFSHGIMNWTKDDHWGFTTKTGVMLKVVNADWAYEE